MRPQREIFGPFGVKTISNLPLIYTLVWKHVSSIYFTIYRDIFKKILPILIIMLQNGLTPLHLCAQEDRVGVADILLKNGAKVDTATKVKLTPNKHHGVGINHHLHCDCYLRPFKKLYYLNRHTIWGFVVIFYTRSSKIGIVVRWLLSWDGGKWFEFQVRWKFTHGRVKVFVPITLGWILFRCYQFGHL